MKTIIQTKLDRKFKNYRRINVIKSKQISFIAQVPLVCIGGLLFITQREYTCSKLAVQLQEQRLF